MRIKSKPSHLTVKGQITLPKIYRDALNWTSNTRLTFLAEADGIKIVAVADTKDAGELLVRRAGGIATSGLSTAEIMRLTRGED